MSQVIKKIRRYWYIFLLLAVVGIGIWWWKRPRPVEYTEYTVTQQPLKVELTVSGSLTAEKLADLKFQAAGRLAWVGVQKGERVKKWQGIASLDKRSLKKTLEKELNDYLNERWDFEDDRDTYHVTTDDLDAYTLTDAARRVLEKAQFDLNNTVLDVEIQTVTNELATIVAPFDGLVAELPKPNPGVNVAITDIIATVVDPDTIYFKAEVDELDIGKLQVGQPVELILDSFPDEPLPSTVTEIGFSPLVLSGGGTGYELKIALPVSNDSLKYKLGMSGDAEVTLAEKDDVLVLPAEAVTQKNGENLVQQLSEGELVEKKIRVGWETDEYVEVLSGLSKGEIVVIPQ